jgi:hypothetical protein
MQNTLYTTRNHIRDLEFKELKAKDLMKRGFKPFINDANQYDIQSDEMVNAFKKDYIMAKDIFKVLRTLEGISLKKIENCTNPYDFVNEVFNLLNIISHDTSNIGFIDEEKSMIHIGNPAYGNYYDSGHIYLDDLLTLDGKLKYKEAGFIITCFKRMGFSYIQDYMFYESPTAISDFIEYNLEGELEELRSRLSKVKYKKVYADIIKELQFHLNMNSKIDEIYCSGLYREKPKTNNENLSIYLDILEAASNKYTIEEFTLNGGYETDDGVDHNTVFGFYYYRGQKRLASQIIDNYIRMMKQFVFEMSSFCFYNNYVIGGNAILDVSNIHSDPFPIIHDIILDFDFKKKRFTPIILRKYDKNRKTDHFDNFKTVCDYLHIPYTKELLSRILTFKEG